MSDVIERASSGRAKCRGCGRAIAKGELRFGEALPNPYGEGDATYWFHPVCAACMRPEKWLAASKTWPETVPDADWLEHAAELGIAHPHLPKLVRAERAPSGRARCQQCREPIEKGAWRIDLQVFEEGRFGAAGSIHASCAEAHFGTADLVDRIRRLTPGLSDDDAAEIARLLSAPAPGLAKTEGDDHSEREEEGLPKRTAG
jgi:hypothetical protein